MRIGHLKVEELFAVTDWCLKRLFPDNYDARCLYSACALHTILTSHGITAIIVGGNVGAFTLSANGREALLEGFGGGDINQPSHYWVEVNGIILDPGISYLPKSSRMNAVPMPMVAWQKSSSLPKYLQYKEIIQYAPEAEYIFPEDIATRVSDFIKICQKRFSSRTAKKKLSTWILSSPQSLNIAARSGDRWANGAIRYQSMTSATAMPL